MRYLVRSVLLFYGLSLSADCLDPREGSTPYIDASPLQVHGKMFKELLIDYYCTPTRSKELDTQIESFAKMFGKKFPKENQKVIDHITNAIWQADQKEQFDGLDKAKKILTIFHEGVDLNSLSAKENASAMQKALKKIASIISKKNKDLILDLFVTLLNYTPIKSQDKLYLKMSQVLTDNPWTNNQEFRRLLISNFQAIGTDHIYFNFSGGDFEWAVSIPVIIKKIEEKYLITGVFGKAIPNEYLGYEVVEFDGQSVEELIAEYKEYHLMFSPVSEAEQAWAEMLLVERSSSRGFLLPVEAASLLLEAPSGEEVQVKLPWSTNVRNKKFRGVAFNHHISDFRLLNTFEHDRNHNLFMGMPSVHGAILDELGMKIAYIKMQSNSIIPLQAHEKHLYVENFKNYVKKFVEAIKFYNKNTDALILDLRNNGGGDFHNIFAALLSSERLQLPFRFHALKSSAAGWSFWMSDDMKAAENRFRRKIMNHKPGYLFKDIPRFGYTFIDPYPEVQYNKPILILVNARSASAAELVPAILQKNGRAKIFGQRTWGGINSIITPSKIKTPFHNFSFIYPSHVISEKTPFEGVIPDYPYQLKYQDIFSGEPYKEAVLEALEETINSSQPQSK